MLPGAPTTVDSVTISPLLSVLVSLRRGSPAPTSDLWGGRRPYEAPVVPSLLLRNEGLTLGVGVQVLPPSSVFVIFAFDNTYGAARSLWVSKIHIY